MLDWFQTIGELIITLCTFIVSFFKNVVELVVLIFKGFSYVATIILYLPVQYQVIILAFVSYSVIVTVVHFGE